MVVAAHAAAVVACDERECDAVQHTHLLGIPTSRVWLGMCACHEHVNGASARRSLEIDKAQ